MYVELEARNIIIYDDIKSDWRELMKRFKQDVFNE